MEDDNNLSQKEQEDKDIPLYNDDYLDDDYLNDDYYLNDDQIKTTNNKEKSYKSEDSLDALLNKSIESGVREFINNVLEEKSNHTGSEYLKESSKEDIIKSITLEDDYDYFDTPKNNIDETDLIVPTILSNDPMENRFSRMNSIIGEEELESYNQTRRASETEINLFKKDMRIPHQETTVMNKKEATKVLERLSTLMDEKNNSKKILEKKKKIKTALLRKRKYIDPKETRIKVR